MGCLLVRQWMGIVLGWTAVVVVLLVVPGFLPYPVLAWPDSTLPPASAIRIPALWVSSGAQSPVHVPLSTLGSLAKTSGTAGLRVGTGARPLPAWPSAPSRGAPCIFAALSFLSVPRSFLRGLPALSLLSPSPRLLGRLSPLLFWPRLLFFFGVIRHDRGGTWCMVLAVLPLL
ncbi:hypothetical protein B0T21DRAFT_357544 [Apiosordaria backusii]|uniref:Uncharacterized protein n=1 Tax=Apiosordaria backusii TaxID=314023 RepID=A0AA40ERP1_9PEZI|nr:hypothetical protein B0T21DRAFT_357544 [Apiosordaria backusii]